MNISIKPGAYVIAVSGGVDSMVLFDVLRQAPGVRLIVAHFDHGIRADSRLDRELVQRVTMSHNILFEYETAQLGSEASEETARDERYDFLRRMCKKYNASAIVTAHHQDDLLETAVLNMQRGTGWRGLSSLRSRSDIIRPFLHVTKKEIEEYAVSHHLEWREDSTNVDMRYARNYIRHHVLSKMSLNDKQRLHQIIVRQNELARQIDAWSAQWLHTKSTSAESKIVLPRYQLIMLPDIVAHELFQAVLRQKTGKSLPRPLVERALCFAKVAKRGKVFQLSKDWQLRVTLRDAIVEPRPSMVS